MPKDELKDTETFAFTAATSELLFALLPFAVVFLVFAYKGLGWEVYLMAPEWAFASALLFGQSVVKIAQGTLNSSSKIRVPVVTLMMSLIIVLGLVPSMVLLAILLIAAQPPLWLGIVQVILSVISGFVFLLFSAIAHEGMQ